MFATERQIADYYERHRFDRETREEACSYCNGSGVLSSDTGPAPKEYECSECSGMGYFEVTK